MRQATRDDTPSLLGRIIGAVMAFAFMMFTVLAIPILLAWKFPIRGSKVASILAGWPTTVFLLFVGLVAMFALIIGFVHGVYGILDVFNLIWETGESHDKDAAASADILKKLIFAAMCVPIVLFVISLLLRSSW